MRHALRRGFTLIEAAVTVAIIGVIAALAYDQLRRSTPRASFDGVAAEIQSLVHEARQEALSSGVNVVVLVFPDYVATSGGVGRIIVLQDDPAAADSLFNAAAELNFDNYVPAAPRKPPKGRIITQLDLPRNVSVGPATGLGRDRVPFPFNNIATDTACSFCAGAGDHRGAIVFDASGRSAFYNATGTQIQNVTGGSLSIYSTDLTVNGAIHATSTLVLTSPFAAMRTFKNG